MITTARLYRLDQACAAQVRNSRDLSFDPPLKRIARLEAQVPLFLAMAREAIRDTVAQQKASQLALVARLAGDKVPPGKADYGPQVRRDRREVVTEERVDLDSDAEFKPTIRAARRADPLRTILRITNVHRPAQGATATDARRWIAATTYRNLIEIAGGARIDDRQMERVDRSMATFGPSDQIVDSLGAVARAKAAMGTNYPAVRWVVEEYSDLDALALVTGQTLDQARTMLMEGLDALADHLAGYEGVAAG